MFDDWESLGERYSNDSRVLIAEMNCDPSSNKKICRKFDVDRYPMIFMFKDGVQGDLYDRKRSKKEFIKYVEDFLKESDTGRDET
jgi:thioredoxin-like negative regulator of GroEL